MDNVWRVYAFGKDRRHSAPQCVSIHEAEKETNKLRAGVGTINERNALYQRSARAPKREFRRSGDKEGQRTKRSEEAERAD